MLKKRSAKDEFVNLNEEMEEEAEEENEEESSEEKAQVQKAKAPTSEEWIKTFQNPGIFRFYQMSEMKTLNSHLERITQTLKEVTGALQTVTKSIQELETVEGE